MMVTCRCGQRFKAGIAVRGKRVPCPSCGHPLDIPAEEVSRQVDKIPVRCDGCGKAFSAAPHLVGRTLSCPSCGGGIQVRGKDALGASAPSIFDLDIPPEDAYQTTLAPATPYQPSGNPKRWPTPPSKWVVALVLCSIWALLTLIGLVSPSFEHAIFAVGTRICVTGIAIGGICCIIQVIARDPLGVLTVLLLGGVLWATGTERMAARAGKTAGKAGLPGLDGDQEMGCAGTLLIFALAGQFLFFINLLLFYVL